MKMQGHGVESHSAMKLVVLSMALISAALLAAKLLLKPVTLLLPTEEDQFWYHVQSQLDASLILTVLASAAIGASVGSVVVCFILKRALRKQDVELVELRATLIRLSIGRG